MHKTRRHFGILHWQIKIVTLTLRTALTFLKIWMELIQTQMKQKALMKILRFLSQTYQLLVVFIFKAATLCVTATIMRLLELIRQPLKFKTQMLLKEKMVFRKALLM